MFDTVARCIPATSHHHSRYYSRLKKPIFRLPLAPVPCSPLRNSPISTSSSRLMRKAVRESSRSEGDASKSEPILVKKEAKYELRRAPSDAACSLSLLRLDLGDGSSVPL
mmetsp:Transcript_38255/g.82403  ORF Transcript_38255/g.82403 Transcript_38255/m.82403 type:complete len:110 (+) Transcript_38255:257-586(+)